VPDPLNLPTAPATSRRAAVAVLVAVAAFAAYFATLLPSLDFGDTAAYQTAVGDWHPTPRQAYPLYFAFANLLFAVVGGEPARALNLLSALAGAAACGVMVWVASGLTGSLTAGVWAGLMMAASYTFWSQAVIGEVYTLHLLLTASVLGAAVWWSRRPSLHRMAALFALYAIGFGNHLMMILLAPALVTLIVVTPGGWRQLCSPAGIGLALVCALGGASQYLWNAAYLWQIADPPPELWEGLRSFWFDVTKADWRSTMVMGVHETALRRRLGLYWFELHQQFGVAGVVAAVAGAVSLWRQPRVLAVLLAAYLTAFVFAYTYNVGDVHVFFLPSHQIAILFGACGVAAVRRYAASRRAVAGTCVAALAVAWPLWRAWDTWPAVDRHEDRRALHWLDGLTGGLGPDTLLLADINWQLENGLAYYTRHVRPELMVVRAADRTMTLPWLIADNLAAGRAIAMTPQSRQVTEAAHGGLFAFAPDPRVDARPLASRLGVVPRGVVYVLAQLAPYRDLPYDAAEAAAVARLLTAGAATLGDGPSYQVMAGRAGFPPIIDRRTGEPFREQLVIEGISLDIRMESWLPADTMRRAGFGHVIADRRHVLTLERGVSLVVLDTDGTVRKAAYASGLLAPLPRVLVRSAPGGR
jgi:hypothetical protein